MEVKQADTTGNIITMVKGRRGYKCCACGMPIKPGEMHYTIVQGGGGLGWLKFPDRCHPECLDNYLGRRKLNDNRVG
jgi:hypothetical protein